MSNKLPVALGILAVAMLAHSSWNAQRSADASRETLDLSRQASIRSSDVPRRGSSWVDFDGVTQNFSLSPTAKQIAAGDAGWAEFLADFKAKLEEEKRRFPPRKD